MKMFYDPASDTFGETREDVPAGAIELDPVKAAMFVRAEQAGQRVDRSRIEEFRLDPDADKHKLIAARRAHRNTLLAESDWTQLPDALGGDEAMKASWRDYRQALRDLDMAGENWPARPGAMA